MSHDHCSSAAERRGSGTSRGEILLWAAGVISTIVLVVKVLGLLGRRRRS